MKSKIISIVAIVALLVICFTCSCSAYWVAEGTSNNLFVPTPNTYSIHDSQRGYVHFGNGNSNGGNTQNNITIGNTDYIYTNRNEGDKNYSEWIIENHSGGQFNRFKVDFPTISVNRSQVPNGIITSLGFYHEQEAYATITYNYRVAWITAQYSESEDDYGRYSLYEYEKQSYQGSIPIKYHFNEADSATHSNFISYKNDPVSTHYTTLSLGIPSIDVLKQYDNGFNDKLLSKQSANGRYHIDLQINVRFSDDSIGSMHGISSIVTTSNNSVGYYAGYDPVRMPLVDTDLSIRVANDFNLFTFIEKSFNAVMSFEIGGITLGDILGIGVAISILVIVLKVFAGG